MGELLADFDVLDAFWMTIQLAVLAGLGSFVLGTLIAVCRLSPVPLLRWFGSAYVTIVRNTPLTLLMVFCQLGLVVQLGMHLVDPKSPTSIKDNVFRVALLALTVYTASFVCEALRSGVNTVPQGQAEAARSIGLGFGQTLRHVILPQAVRAAVTPLANVFIALTKNTTVASVIGVAEISYLMADMTEQRPDQIVGIFLIVAIGFVILTLPLGVASTWLAQRLAVKR